MTIENTLILMNEYSLSAEEVFFLSLLLLACTKEQKCDYVLKYFKVSKKHVIPMLQHFQDLGIITKKYDVPKPGEQFDPNNIDFNLNFIKRWHKFSGDLGLELWKSYPAVLNINGRYFPAKNISKKFDCVDDFFFFYGKEIHFSEKEHQDVLELLDWAKGNNLIKSGINEFVISRQWEVFKQLRDNGFDGNTLNVDELL